MSNQELARRTGWSEQRVYRLLTGRTDFHADDVELVADKIGRPVAELYGEASAS